MSFGHDPDIAECPLCPRKQTCAVQLGMSAKCQKRTFGLAVLGNITQSTKRGLGYSAATTPGRLHQEFFHCELTEWVDGRHPINLKAAQNLKINIPATLHARSDDVIE